MRVVNVEDIREMKVENGVSLIPRFMNLTLIPYRREIERVQGKNSFL